jgi:Spy/CpxP family protein refolding chaperone
MLFVYTESCMKKIAIIFLTLASATSLFAQSVNPSPAEEGKPGTPPDRRPMKNWLWDRLNLTDDQQEKLKQIREADRESLSSACAQVAIAGESLKAALLANPENVADIQTKATGLANALSTGSVQLALHLANINQVLTPAQRVELTEAKSRHIRAWLQELRPSIDGPSQDQCPSQRKDQSPRPTPAPMPDGG